MCSCVYTCFGEVRVSRLSIEYFLCLLLSISHSSVLCSASFGNWWFVSHLTDLLYHLGVLESSQIKFVGPWLTYVPVVTSCMCACVVSVLNVYLRCS